MSKRIEGQFIFMTAVLLFVSGAAKWFTALVASSAFDQPDALFSVSNRWLFVLIGSLELAVSACLLILTNRTLRLILIAWTAMNLLVYRVGLECQGAANFVDCLGNFNEWLPVSPRVLGPATTFLQCFFLIGSSVFLVLAWLPKRQQKRPEASVLAAKQRA